MTCIYHKISGLGAWCPHTNCDPRFDQLECKPLAENDCVANTPLAKNIPDANLMSPEVET